jgi:hypothetical protein
MNNPIEQAPYIAKTSPEAFVLTYQNCRFEVTTSDDLVKVLSDISLMVTPSSVSIDNAIRGVYIHGLYRAAAYFFSKDELDEMELGGWQVLDVNADYLILIPELIAQATGVRQI